MTHFKLFSIVIFSAFLLACGDNGGIATVDASPGHDAGGDLNASTCGCSRPSDCASGICCVQHSANFGGSAQTMCVATAADCAYEFYVDGGRTIACASDSDCAKEDVPDGGVTSGPLTCSGSDSSCGTRLCIAN